jgi:hypothetical protein
MLWHRADCRCVTHLDQAAPVHHRNAVAHPACQCEVVGDEKVGEAMVALEVTEEVHHLALRGDIQGRDRLVEHQDSRPSRKRTRQHHALTLTS